MQKSRAVQQYLVHIYVYIFANNTRLLKGNESRDYGIYTLSPTDARGKSFRKYEMPGLQLEK